MTGLKMNVLKKVWSQFGCGYIDGFFETNISIFLLSYFGNKKLNSLKFGWYIITLEVAIFILSSIIFFILSIFYFVVIWFILMEYLLPIIFWFGQSVEYIIYPIKKKMLHAFLHAIEYNLISFRTYCVFL